jgi:hypothetical protein
MEEESQTPSLYEQDFYSWSQEQAHLLRTLQLRGIDAEHIAEEIETLGRSEQNALRSSLRLVITHLLKALYQPERAGRSWRVTVVRERLNAQQNLRDNPGLRAQLESLFAEAYEDGRKLALAETGLPSPTIPTQAALTLGQVLDEAFLPASLQDAP